MSPVCPSVTMRACGHHPACVTQSTGQLWSKPPSTKCSVQGCSALHPSFPSPKWAFPTFGAGGAPRPARAGATQDSDTTRAGTAIRQGAEKGTQVPPYQEVPADDDGSLVARSLWALLGEVVAARGVPRATEVVVAVPVSLEDLTVGGRGVGHELGTLGMLLRPTVGPGHLKARERGSGGNRRNKEEVH